VSDDGRGINSDSIEKIFEPFYTTKRGSGGSGLGLSIIYNLITQRLKGDIRCESVMGKGTVFSIVLPVALDELGDL
jgi:signal transduction histidine kinase